MRAVAQRVSRAAVLVAGREIAAIGRGLVVLAAAAPNDEPADVEYLAEKLANLRIFERDGRMEESLLDCGGGVLLISQFTLYAETRKGRRPDFSGAARPDVAEPLLALLGGRMRELGVEVQTGEFGARMVVEMANDGPVTIILDSAERRIPRRQV